jgi:hypothetical protein
MSTYFSPLGVLPKTGSGSVSRAQGWHPLRHTGLSAVLAAISVFTGLAQAEGRAEAANANPDKSGYSLWNPTPPDVLRELSTDRPDQTESPYTVDAGHFQIEMDFFNYTYDHDKSGGSDVRTKDLAVAPFNLKVGLLNNVDLQLLVDPYVRTRTEDRVANTKTDATGFGDITSRLKINLWGNDGGSTAFAIMPFVKWPLSASDVRNGDTEGGVIFILGYELPAGWGSAVMTEVDFVSDGSGSYAAEWLNSITFSHDITEKIGGYFELVVVTSGAADFRTLGQFDLGLTYAVADNTQLDLGCNFGITDAAPDYQPFAGVSRRF